MAAYPTDTPTEEIQTLFNILTGREERDMQVAAKAGWVVQGYLQKLIIGEPGSSIATAMPVPRGTTLNDAQGVALLESMANGKGDVEIAGVVGDVISRQFASMLMPLLMRWLSEFLESGGLDRVIDRILEMLGVSLADPATA